MVATAFSQLFLTSERYIKIFCRSPGLLPLTPKKLNNYEISSPGNC